MSQIPPYTLTSVSSGLKVGVPISTGSDQLVVLNANVTTWFSSRSITESGPVRLGVGSYQYTTSQGDVVLASKSPGMSQDWYLFPTDQQMTYRIATDPTGIFLWTASQKDQPIRITTYLPGGDSDIYNFTFAPLK